MRNNIIEEVPIYMTVAKEIICDCCGDKVTGVEEVRMCDIQTQRFEFGYGSRFDTDEFEVDICDDCLEQMFENFNNNPLDNLDTKEDDGL